MRMRTHIESLSGGENMRPHLIKEDERPDHAPVPVWQGAAHLELITQIMRARHDDDLQCGIENFIHGSATSVKSQPLGAARASPEQARAAKLRVIRCLARAWRIRRSCSR
jgi:hypothetical protein